MRRHRKKRGARSKRSSPGPVAPAAVAQAHNPLETITLLPKDFLPAALVVLAGVALYGLTACRNLYVGDSPELAAVAATFGVAHPPGYPLYTMVSAMAVHLLAGLGKALAANLMSGVYASLTMGLLFLLLRRLTVPLVGCWFAVACLGLGQTFWSQSVVAEVYTFDTLLLLLVLHTSLTAMRAPRSARALLWGLGLGLWLGHRISNVFYLPAVIALAWAISPKGQPLQNLLARPRLLSLLAGLALAGLPFAYLPLASSADPYFDMGDPQRWDQFWKVVLASPYRGLLGGVAPEVALQRLGRLLCGIFKETGPACVIGLWGVIHLFKGGRARRMLLACLMLVVAAGLFFTAAYDIMDYDAYLLPTYVAISILGGVGAARLLAHTSTLKSRVLTMALLCSCLVMLPFNYSRNNLRGDNQVYRMARDILDSVDQKALLVTFGDTTSWALANVQAVEGRAPAVIVVRVGLISDWYMAQLAARFPGEDWPGYDPRLTQAHNAFRILQRLSRSRPAFLTLSVNPAEFFPRPNPYGLVPRGLVKEVRPRGERFNLRERALWNKDFFDLRLPRLGRMRADMDMDLKSLYLQYALSLLDTCKQLLAVKQLPLAEACLADVLKMTPSRYNEQLRQEVLLRSGLKIPPLKIEHQARKLMERLRTSHLPRRQP